MNRAAVDIGTNSMRLLIVDGDGREIVRVQRVTGLGRGVDATGRFNPQAVARTVEVLAGYGEAMRANLVGAARAVATSASRDAANREQFLDRAEIALGIRPEVISGDAEAALAYAGATAAAGGAPIVVDIGGGSTEFVWRSGGVIRSVSFDVGSVRLTDRCLSDRPATFDDLETAGRVCRGLFAELGGVPERADVIGVAGTWTSLAGITAGTEDRTVVEGFALFRSDADRTVLMLAGLTVGETAALPGLDPARAPVILAGAIVAREAMARLGADRVTVSEHDLLDGVVAALNA